MASGPRSNAPADPGTDTGMLATDNDSTNDANAAPEPVETETQRSASGEYRVLVGAFNLSEDKDGKNVRRYTRGQRVKPGDHVDIDRLLALRVLEPFGTKAQSIGPSTAAHLARAANAAAEENEPEFLDDGTPEEVTGEGSDA